MNGNIPNLTPEAIERLLRAIRLHAGLADSTATEKGTSEMGIQKGTAVAVNTASTEPAVDWTKIDTQIEFEGKKIVLPGDPGEMDYDVAISTIGRIRDAERQKYDVKELVAGAPWDAAVAVFKAMQDIYGVVLPESRQTWFGEVKPDMLTVNTGPGERDKVQVPLGQMRLPNVSEPVHVIMQREGVYVIGTVSKKDRAILVDIANRARVILQTDSVYKGKAIHFKVDEEGDLQLGEQPEFINLAGVKEDDMIHTAETGALINTAIFAPLKNTAACRKHRIPLKRGVLLSGKYGTGKSLTARVTAKVATDNDWTFIMLNRAQGLKAAIEFARTYQPCAIFAEDIDRAADRSDEQVNELVNLLDGLITKDMEMMVVLTTNFIEKIDKALLRPGRFDAIVTIQPPDADTAVKLVRAYARDLLGKNEDLTEVGEAIAGSIPATIREVVERAKLSMLVEDRSKLTAKDLHTSAIGMKQHMALLEPVPEAKSAAQQFVDGFAAIIRDAQGVADEELATEANLSKIGKSLATRSENTRRSVQELGQAVASAAGSASHAADLAKEAAKAGLANTAETRKVRRDLKALANGGRIEND